MKASFDSCGTTAWHHTVNAMLWKHFLMARVLGEAEFQQLAIQVVTPGSPAVRQHTPVLIQFPRWGGSTASDAYSGICSMYTMT